MNEEGVWQTLKKGLTNKCLMTRIESCTGNGIPDVCVHMIKRHIWIELKHIPGWPSRESTPVKLPLRVEQRQWLNNKGSLSGGCWVFIRIADDFFLMPWDVAIHVHDVGFKKQEWLKYPFYWHKKIDWDEFYQILREVRDE